MSGIVGSRLNNRGSGLIGSLGTDGQVLTSSGAGVGAVYEAAAGGVSGMTSDGTDITITSGDLIVGTAGKGIDFSAQTPAAGMETEILNHYETGTWTAAIETNYGSVTTSETVNTMWYTKIGKMVHVQGGCNASAISSPNGNLKLTGLPWAAGGSGSTSQYGYSAMGGCVDDFDSMESMQVIISHNGPNVWFEQFSGGQSTHPGNLVTATTQLKIGGTYMAAA